MTISLGYNEHTSSHFAAKRQDRFPYVCSKQKSDWESTGLLDTRELGNSAGGDVIDLSSAPMFQPLNGLVGSRTGAAFRQPTDIL